MRRVLRRRGLAMLLVIIGLGAATIVAMSYLSSRDNSAAIGQNVTDSAAARWAAVTGITLACAIMETPTEWWNEHDQGVLLQDYHIGDALVTVELEDMEAQGPPKFGSRYITVTSRARIGGVEQEATARATVEDTKRINAVNVDLSEFAVFTGEHMELSHEALVSRWATSPIYALGHPIYLGTHATESFRIELRDFSAVINGIVYHVDNASEYLYTDEYLKRRELQDLIPFPNPPATGVEPPDGNNAGNFNASSDYVFTNNLYRFETFEFGTDSNQWNVATVHSETIVVDDNFLLKEHSGLRIENDVSLIVFEDFSMDQGSYIEIAPEATFRLFVKGDVELRDAYIGAERDDLTKRDSSGEAKWMDANRIRIYSIMDEDAIEPNWRLRDNSVIKGQMYAPNVQLRIRDESALYGRAAVNQLRLRDTAAIFYDPTLNTRVGYTNPKSQLFTETGRIRDEFKGVTNLTGYTLEQLADTVELNILHGDLIYGEEGDAGLLESTLNLLGLGGNGGSSDDPTPRVIPVYYELTAIGDDVREWEGRYERAAYRENEMVAGDGG